MSYEYKETELGGKPTKEMRTVRREGDLVTEDHERLNPDGTVTKTLTTTDERTGQKHITIYRMDKSGIVRKVADFDPKTLEEGAKRESTLQKLKDKMAETEEKLAALKERMNQADSKSVAYETGDPYYKDGIAYTKKVEEVAPDKHEMAFSMRNINKPIELTQKQRAILEDHKENIINYGTKKLITQLNKKLNDDKFNETYPLTDEQKDKVIEYGIRKFHRLLEKNLDDERLIYDVMALYPDFGEVDLSGRGIRQMPGSRSVNFTLNPYKNIAEKDTEKAVSFSMRPEKPSQSLPEPTGDRRDNSNNEYDSLWKRIMMPTKKTKQKELLYDDDETSKSDDNDSDGRDNQYDEEESEREDYKKFKKTLKKLIQEDKIYKKSALTPEQKEGIMNHALEQVRSQLKKHSDAGDKDSSKKDKKIDLLEYFDEDEIYDYGKRALKRLVKRSLKGFDLDQETIRQDDIDDPNVSARRDAFYQYLGDILDGKVKESDPLPIKPKKIKEKEESDEENGWDFLSMLSNIFSDKKKEKNQEIEEKPKEQEQKVSNLDSYYSKLRSEKEKKSEQPGENPFKFKKHFYQLEPENNSKNEQNQSEGNDSNFDLKALLRKIQSAAIKKLSNENSENTDSTQNQEQVQTNVDNNTSAQQRQLKPQEVDAALSRIRENNSEASNSRRVAGTNKPPYLKERISGLNSIPIPKIVSASPLERNVDLSNQISFQLKPQIHESNKQVETPRSLENQRVETQKPSSHEQDFQPWWFESPDSFIKKAFSEKPLIKESFVDPPVINTSFSTGGNGFSTGGSFSSGKILE